MGGKSSKKRVEDDEIPVVDATASGSEIVESEDKYDAQEIKNMLNELRTRPERFILDNLLMCLVLFRNFEKDLYDFSNTVVPKEETDLNLELEKEVKSCILPDTLLDKVQENVRFLSEDGKKYERLAHQTVYVVNENIEVKDRTDKTFYTNIDVPGCVVEIEEEEDDLIFTDGRNQSYVRKKKEPRYGFLKLRVIENSSKMDRENFAERSLSVDSKTAESSESSEEQSDEYSTITAFKTPVSLHIVRTSETERRDTLPDTCFSKRKRWLTLANEEEEEDYDQEDDEEDLEDSDDYDDEEEEENQRRNSELYEDVTYLSSKGFMEYFQNNIFPNVTGKILGFSDKALETAKAVPGSILCDKEVPDEKIPFRVVPAVAIDWPMQATEYLYRKDRRTIIDQKYGVVYRWPTREMVQELVTLKCVAIPKGFVMKKGENENSDIEWEIHFPKATRYLEVRMTHPQVRCYVFLLALYKTYIEKVTTFHGLLIEHIRTHMFWECETDSRNWPEHRMGRKLLKVIEDLNDGLSRSKIRHYFIRKKNCFEDIPSKYLQFAQKAFHDVLQFPVTHFIKALKNLKYAHSDFYPTPDLNRLQQILADEHKMRTPQRQRSRKETKKNRKSVLPVGTVRGTGKVKIKDKKLKEKREKKNRRAVLDQQKQKKEEEEKAKTTKVEENLKVSYSNMSVMTQVSVLHFFINHFVEVAKISRKIGPKSQTILYLKQAWYNTKVLEAITYSCEDTQNILKVIEKEREFLERDSSQDIQMIAPPTPMRNPEQNSFDFMEGNVHLRLKPSFKRNVSNEGGVMRNRRVLKRHKSVGFDDSVKED
ncbi:uncharacterized protein LOC123312890 [Coccinella septempunctata]|uniref:uncharacterized protein LOC123312890 n=1 Tax=Coccinella septempunctata TaxID=41139 RepID=UPI001D088BBD|nr:uncharacterized protein LOC123312890 [Coccinella septempunctata]